MHPHRLAVGDAQLLAHEIHTIHELGDRMLDLNAGVHLEEVELTGRRQQKLDRSRADVADRAGCRGGGFRETPAQRR